METTKETKREINYHANLEACNKIPQAQRLVTSIGFNATSDDKYEVYFLIPTTDEEAKVRYDCDLPALVEMGIRQISTRLGYKKAGYNDDGTLKEGGHKAMQAEADGYKVGAKREGTGGQKVKAQQWDKVGGMFAALGITTEDIAACAGDDVALGSLIATKTKSLAKKAR